MNARTTLTLLSLFATSIATSGQAQAYRMETNPSGVNELHLLDYATPLHSINVMWIDDPNATECQQALVAIETTISSRSLFTICDVSHPLDRFEKPGLHDQVGRVMDWIQASEEPITGFSLIREVHRGLYR